MSCLHKKIKRCVVSISKRNRAAAVLKVADERLNKADEIGSVITTPNTALLPGLLSMTMPLRPIFIKREQLYKSLLGRGWLRLAPVLPS